MVKNIFVLSKGHVESNLKCLQNIDILHHGEEIKFKFDVA